MAGENIGAAFGILLKRLEKIEKDHDELKARLAALEAAPKGKKWWFQK